MTTRQRSRVLCAVTDCRIPGRHRDDCDKAYAEQDRCRGCLRATAADGIRLCTHHRRLLGEDALVAVIRFNDLGLVLAASGRLLGEVVASRGADPNLALNHAAAAARARIRHELVALVRLVARERGVSLPGGWAPERLGEGFIGPPRLVWRVADRLPALGRFVAKHAEWLAAHPAADEHSAVLRELAEGAAYRIAYPAGTRRFVLSLPDGSPARCPQTVVDADADGQPVEGAEPTPCPGALWTVLRPRDSLWPSELLCNHDPDAHRWPAKQWLGLGPRLLAMQAASTVEAAEGASVPEMRVA